MNTVIKVTAIAAALSAVVGCTAQQTTSSDNSSLNPDDLLARNEALLAKEAELAKKQAELEDLKASLNQQQASASQPVYQQQPSESDTDLLPPSANAGECYARVWVEPVYQNVSEEVLVKEASSRIEIIPAQYQMVEEQVLVKEAGSRVDTIPATYDTVSEEKLVEQGGVYWRIDNAISAAPAGQEILDKAEAHGIDLASARAGDCFHEHFVPAKYEKVDEQVLVKEAYDVLEAKEAEYRWVEKEVLVSEASTKIEEVPAVYETVTEEVIDVPAHTVWKKGAGPIQKLDEATGEIMCLVDVPATYKTVTKEVLASAATTRVVEIPAEYKTVKVKELVSDASEIRTTIPAQYKTVQVTQQVADASFVWHEVADMSMSSKTRTGHKICLVEQKDRYETVERTVVKTPAQTNVVEIPAEYETVQVQKLLSAAAQNEIEIPAEYSTVELRQVKEAGFMEWRPILCETNMNTATITDIQNALDTRGYNPGVIDGVIGRDTMKAVNSFQRDNSLPVDDYLNMATIRALGVSI